jgi:hypothetical protein
MHQLRSHHAEGDLVATSEDGLEYLDPSGNLFAKADHKGNFKFSNSHVGRLDNHIVIVIDNGERKPMYWHSEG